MNAVHSRWELVEPFLLANCLRDPLGFESGMTERSIGQGIESLGDHFDKSAVARATAQLGDAGWVAVNRQEPLSASICDAAERWLVAEGKHWALRVQNRHPGHEIIRWRGATMLLPPSILIAGALARTDGLGPRRVQTLPDSIAPREPVGHLHVHLGPMLPFEALWSELRYAFLQRGTLDAATGKGIDAMKGTDVPEIGRHPSKRQPGERWQYILELAFAARTWLAAPEDGELVPSSLRPLGSGRVRLRDRPSTLLTLWSEGPWKTQARREARGLLQSRLERTRIEARQELLELHRTAGAPDCLSSDGSRDRRAPEHSRPTDADKEIVFLAKGLRRCASDDSYARIYYQYLRVKVALYSSLVVDPWTTGLRHFLDVVQRDGPYANAIRDPARLGRIRLQAAETESPLRIGALEIHVRPTRWIRQPRRVGDRMHAWVLSFVRARRPDSGDPTGECAAAHWRPSMAEAGTMCRIIARRMQARPSALREVRGLSLMDWERNGPVWLFESAFRRLLETSADVAAGHPALALRPLETALHLGEDFDHLMSGLRQIYEPFEWGLIRRGDRIGHALALGRSWRHWCEEHPWVRMRPWDRILDLGFVYWAFHTFRLPLNAECIERMRQDAQEAIAQVFDARSTADGALDTARDLWLSLPRRAPEGGEAKGSTPRLAGARAMKDRILDEPTVGRRALSLSLAVETKYDIAMLEAVHELVLRQVEAWNVAVEVNPSSNLLVGGFRSIFEQPVFHTDRVPITLNADDPLTFATTLADEYAYAWAGMVVGSNDSPDQATRRLEAAARCSLRYAFTASLPGGDEPASQ